MRHCHRRRPLFVLRLTFRFRRDGGLGTAGATHRVWAGVSISRGHLPINPCRFGVDLRRAAEPDGSQQQTAVQSALAGIDVQTADAVAGTSDVTATAATATHKQRSFRRVSNTVRSRSGPRSVKMIASNSKY